MEKSKILNGLSVVTRVLKHANEHYRDASEFIEFKHTLDN